MYFFYIVTFILPIFVTPRLSAITLPLMGVFVFLLIFKPLFWANITLFYYF